jgi:uncharacterized protein YjdB
MRFRMVSIRRLSRPALAGLGLAAFVSMSGVNGCISYKLTGIHVEPSAGACIAPASTAQFTAYGTYTEGGHTAKTEVVTDQVSWTTDLPELATVSAAGLATAGDTYVGLTNVTATTQGEFGVETSSAPLTVSTSCVTSSPSVVPSGMHILPGDQNLGLVGDTSKVVAVGQYSGAPWSRDLSQQAAWTSSNPKVATVTSDGLITAMGAGEATIIAAHTTERGTVVTSAIKVEVGGASATP